MKLIMLWEFSRATLQLALVEPSAARGAKTAGVALIRDDEVWMGARDLLAHVPRPVYSIVRCVFTPSVHESFAFSDF